MRRLLLILAVLLSAVGFTTHAADVTVNPPTGAVTSASNIQISSGDTKHYYQIVNYRKPGSTQQASTEAERAVLTVQTVAGELAGSVPNNFSYWYITGDDENGYVLNNAFDNLPLKYNGKNGNGKLQASLTGTETSTDLLLTFVNKDDTYTKGFAIVVKNNDFNPNNQALDFGDTGLSNWQTSSQIALGNTWYFLPADEETVNEAIEDQKLPVALPTEENPSVDMVFQARNNPNYFLGAIHLSAFAFATKDANEHIVWTIEKTETDGQYYIKNKGLSYDEGVDMYLGIGEDNFATITSEPTPYIIADQTTAGYVYIQPASWETSMSGKGLNAQGGFGNNVITRPRVQLNDFDKNDPGSGWLMMNPGKKSVLQARTNDLATFCENTTTLIDYFAGINGLIKEGSDVETLKTTLSNVSSTVLGDDSPTGDELETEFHKAHQAKIDFYATIDAATNISLQAKDNNYLYNHLESEGTGTTPQPHAHASETLGFAAIWHLVNSTASDFQNSGIHINSYYRSATENIGPGMDGASMDNDGWTPSWYTITVNNENVSGILWTNANGYQYLNTDATHPNAPSNVNRDINSGSLWTIDRVYVPKTITIVEAPADDTPATTAEGDDDNSTITILSNGAPVKLTTVMTSDVEGQDVTPGLTGVNWTINPETGVASIEGNGELGSAYPEDAFNDLNGYTFGIVTPTAPGTATITATSPMFQNPGDGRENPFGEVTLTVEKPTYSVVFDPTAISDMTTTSEDLTVTVKIMDGETEVDDATWEYALTTGDDNTAVTTGISQNNDTKALTLSGLAAGSYKLTITAPEDAEYLFNTEDDANTLAFTVAQTSYTVEFTSTDATVSGATATVKGTEASISVAFKDGETAVEPAPAVTVSLKKGEEDVTPAPELTDGEIALTDLEANTTYTLLISAPENAPYELTGNELTITVKAADAPEYTASLTGSGIDEGKATVEAGNDVTATVALTDAESQAVTTVTAADLTATVSPADKGVTAAIAEVDGTLTLTVTTTAEAEAGEYTIAVAPAETAAFTIAENALTVTVTAAPEPITGIEITTPAADLAAEVAAEATTATVAIAGKVIPAGATIPEDAKVTFTATCETEGVSAAIDDATIGTDGTFTATATVTVTDGTTLTEAATISVTATYTEEITATFAITVTKATSEEPTPEEGTVTALVIDPVTAEVTDGSATATISGSFTMEQEGTVAPADTEVTLAVKEPATEGITVTPGTVTVDAAKGTFTGTADITVAEGTELPATVTLTATCGDVTEDVTITITEKTTPDVPGDDEPISEELPVTKPEVEEGDTAAPAVEVTTDTETGKPEVTIDFNASPADEEGAPATPVMTVELPKAADAEDINTEAFTAEVLDENDEATTAATVAITAEGVKIDASKAKIGDIIRIIIRKVKQTIAPETQSLALLAEGEEEENPVAPETPAETDDDDIVMTIDVTIYGVEFTTAPATATIGADGSVEVTFATNDATPDDATVEITAAPAEGDALTAVDGKITFTEAGTYTVTAKAGDNYVANTKIIVKNAPTVTGIEAVNADAAAGTAAIYDLQGRRLTRVNAAGIYIVNGVKTLVR